MINMEGPETGVCSLYMRGRSLILHGYSSASGACPANLPHSVDALIMAICTAVWTSPRQVVRDDHDSSTDPTQCTARSRYMWRCASSSFSSCSPVCSYSHRLQHGFTRAPWFARSPSGAKRGQDTFVCFLDIRRAYETVCRVRSF